MSSGGLAPVTALDGYVKRTPVTLVMLSGAQLEVTFNPPRIGEHTDALLAQLGHSDQQILAIKETRIAKST